ncbi:MAG: type II toxin-antitoxin system RelE/ParE family toxin [Bacteroidia bacterium]|jgi:hypothetical protein|nr:type II toxin-antitoxin system RelE/ParE family toxin [Bacteroidia bacterium]
MAPVRKYKLLRKANIDILATYDYYSLISKDLGDRFWEEIQETIQIVCKYPLSRSLYWNNFRAVLLPSFPYLLVYVVKPDMLVFHSLSHARENPEKFKRQVK